MILIAAGAFEPFYFKVFALDRGRFGDMLVELPFRKTPGLRRFLNDVRAHTRDGDSIAIAAPYTKWEGGYDYCYSRALYPLAGRRVLPLLDPADRFHPETLAAASHIAAYRSEPVFAGFAPVWRSNDGVLLARQH